MDRTRGIMVKPLAPSAYDVFTMERYAIGINPHTGETFLIHTEGVAYRVTHDKPWRFNDYSLTARFHTLMDVRNMPTVGEIDLADWVRSFGARLESNFWQVSRVLTSTEPTEDDYNPAVYETLNEILAGVDSADDV